MAVRASSIDVRLRLRGQRQFKREVVSAGAELEAMGLKGAKALGTFASKSRALKDFGATWSRNVTLPIIGLGAVSTKMFMDFDDSMNKMVGLVGINRKQVQAWHEDVLDLSTVTGRAPTELADALFFITSAGLRGKTAIDALTVSAKAADAGLGETKVVADAVTSAMNAYGPANLSAAQATNVLVAAVREGKLEASQLAPVIGGVIPLAEAMGVSFAEAAGSIAMMARAGTNPAKAATQVSAILSTFTKPTGDMKTALKQMGLSIDEVRRRIDRDGLLDTLAMLRSGASKTGIELSEIFGNKRAIIGVLQLTKNVRQTRGVLDGVANSAGLTNKAFREAQKTAGDKLNDALNSLKVTAIRLGAALGPVVAPMLAQLGSALAGLGESFSELSPEMQKTVLVGIGIVAAIGPAASVMGYFAGSVGRVIIPLAKFLRFTKGFMALRAGVGAIEALRIALAGFGLTLKGVMITTGIGLAIAAILLLDQKFHFLGPTVEFVTAILGKAFAWIKTAAGDVFNWLKSNWPLLVLIILSPIGLVVISVVKHFDTIKGAVVGGATAIIGFLKSVWQSGVFKILTWPIRTYIKFQVKLWMAVKDVLLKAFGIVKSVWPAVSEFLKDPIGNAIKFIRSGFTSLIGFVASLPGRISSATSGMWSGIKAAFKGAINWIIEKWNALELRIGGISIDPPGPGSISIDPVSLKTPNIPRLERGGNVLAPGAVEVGERGPEILQLPRAARVTPLDPAPINMKNVIGGVKTVIVKSILDGKQIAESTAQVAEDQAALAP